MAVRNRFAELHDEISGWRREMHRHPELQFDVERTAGFVEELLRDFGCDEVVAGIGRTGVVGLIRGRKTGSGRVIGLRADMDALPIHEATGVEYASTVPGKMHACGHDGHTAMLLGAAKYLAETRNFDGTIAVIFQPAEEGGGGGREMVNDGLMERFGIDEVYGMHNVPGRALGEFAIRPGAFYASTDEIHITITGKGGHAAQPHQTVDATLVGAHVVTALQTIVSRQIDPVDQVVVSITSFETSTTAYNVVVEEVVLKGTLRTMTEENRTFAKRRIVEIATGISASLGAKGDAQIHEGYPVMINSAEHADFAAQAAAKVAGKCETAPVYLWGEDFGYMLNARPGAYIHLGIGDNSPLHHPEYNFNDEAIPAGCSFFVELAESRLPIAS
ncbi:amidohydrolase [Boseongicola aestuarii]|uniref:Putative hydrolase YxeP n=1 Tax=Boseongicola aestuarii TaxID=1470561 RepID=A0A238IX97_9RHOB|nr:amidohydrolase [Boseongicola aestuarii]SMX22380.1 putative hydrolase YxeP [Boseongicola aestuarii]